MGKIEQENCPAKVYIQLKENEISPIDTMNIPFAYEYVHDFKDQLFKLGIFYMSTNLKRLCYSYLARTHCASAQFFRVVIVKCSKSPIEPTSSVVHNEAFISTSAAM